MDVDDVEPAFDFESEGPGMGDAYPVNEEGNMDEPEITYDAMESAFNDDEEMDEQDISGVQGIYGDMDPAFDFDSKGPGSAGPYQTRNEAETSEQIPRKHDYKKMLRKKDALSRGEDFDDSELDISDYEGEYSPETSSWEEITKMTGDDEFANVDEDIRESLINQKNKINEMMLRMKVIK